MGKEKEVPSSFTRPSVFEEGSQPPFKSKRDKKRRKRDRSRDRPREREDEERPRTADEITISLNPWKIGKVVLILLAVVVVFYAGRFSTISTSDEQSTISSLFGAISDKSEDSYTPSATVVLEDTSIEVAPVEEPAETAAEEPAAEETEETEEVVEEVEEEVEEEPEVVITTYKNVALAINDAYIKWMDTWGKITGLKYTIKNNEDGTIKPDHFMMLVEGYGDAEKKFSVGTKSQEITSATSISDETAVSGGFSYSSATTGDLTDVKINLYLYDAADKLIAHASRELDLSGE